MYVYLLVFLCINLIKPTVAYKRITNLTYFYIKQGLMHFINIQSTHCKNDYRLLAEQKQSIGLLINYSSMTEISTIKKSLSVFSLIRTKKDCYYSPVTVDYTPLKGINQTVQTILPKFNLDENFFTPAFINPYQNVRLKENSVEAVMKEKEKFLKKVESYDNSMVEQTPLFNPRDDNYCCLCKTSFKSYWEHVNGKIHIKRIKSNKINDYIHDLCRKLNQKDNENSQNENQQESTLGKKKKIFKRAKKLKKIKEQQVFTKQDFIIKLPSDLFQKEVQNINYNISTKGLNSMEQFQFKA